MSETGGGGSASNTAGNPPSDASRNMIVIGAGIVGICCALYLQRDGHRVTVLDPQEPGGGASFGNSGIFATDHCAPNAKPGLLWELPRMLLDPLGPLTLRWRYLPRALPWLWRFLAAGRPEAVEAASLALHALNLQAMEAYRPLLDDAQAHGLIRKNGWLLVYESTAAFERARPLKIDLRHKRGVPLEVLDAKGVRELEPALTPAVRHGVYFPEVSQTTDPFALVQALAADFRRRGGVIQTGRVTGFGFGPGGVEKEHTDGGPFSADGVVLAAGAHSKTLARRLGAKVPLDTERGYHAMLPDPGISLKVPVISGDFHCAMTPMDGGLRVGGSVELAGVDAPPNYARADKLVSVAKRVLPGLNDAGVTRWMGRRPSMPDSLPVIGPSPRVPNAFFAFGHGMLGLTHGALTGRIVADLVAGRAPPLDLTPYRPERF